MKFLFDENIPLITEIELNRHGYNAVSIRGKASAVSDMEVLEIARREKRIIITFDKDFGEIVFRSNKKSEGVVLLRFEPVNPAEVTGHLLTVLKEPHVKPAGNFVIIEKDKVRIRKLP